MSGTAAPVERRPQAVLERHGGRVAEQRFRLRDVGLRIADVAGARTLIESKASIMMASATIPLAFE
jgi:hypothetical protein